MIKQTDIIQKIQSQWFLVVAFLLPFPQEIVKWSILIWFGLWLIEGRWLHRPQSIRDNRIVLGILLFGVWFLLKAVSVLWAPDHHAWYRLIERYATFGAVIPIGIWGINKHYDWKKIATALVFGCLTVGALYPFVLYWVYNDQYFALEISTGTTQDMPIEWYAGKVSYIKHRLFLCSEEAAGIIASLSLYSFWKEQYGKKCAILIEIMTVTLMLATILLTGSRQSIFSISGIAIVALCMFFPFRTKRKWGISIVSTIVLISIVAILFHPRMQTFEWKEISQFMQIDSTHEIRLNIWGFSLSSPNDYLAYGLGAGQIPNYLTDKYTQAEWLNYLNRGFDNCHNQYLTELLENGIGGLILFLLCWGGLIYFAKGRARQLAVLLTTLYGLNMCTDCMFGRFDGLALWGFSIIILLILSRNKDDNAKEENYS